MYPNSYCEIITLFPAIFEVRACNAELRLQQFFPFQIDNKPRMETVGVAHDEYLYKFSGKLQDFF